jgi:hypothetical protein
LLKHRERGYIKKKKQYYKKKIINSITINTRVAKDTSYYNRKRFTTITTISIEGGGGGGDGFGGGGAWRSGRNTPLHRRGGGRGLFARVLSTHTRNGYRSETLTVAVVADGHDGATMMMLVVAGHWSLIAC